MSSDPPCKYDDVQITTVPFTALQLIPFTALSDKVCIKYKCLLF